MAYSPDPPLKRNFCPKNISYLPSKNIFFERTDHMTHSLDPRPPKIEIFLPKKVLILNTPPPNPKKLINKLITKNVKRKSFYTLPKNRFFTRRKNFLYLSEKNNQKKTFIITGKNNFSNKRFLIPVWETIFLYFREKVKGLHFRCILNTALLFFMLAKLDRVFEKLMIVLLCL